MKFTLSRKTLGSSYFDLGDKYGICADAVVASFPKAIGICDLPLKIRATVRTKRPAKADGWRRVSIPTVNTRKFGGWWRLEGFYNEQEQYVFKSVLRLAEEHNFGTETWVKFEEAK